MEPVPAASWVSLPQGVAREAGPPLLFCEGIVSRKPCAAAAAAPREPRRVLPRIGGRKDGGLRCTCPAQLCRARGGPGQSQAKEEGVCSEAAGSVLGL